MLLLLQGLPWPSYLRWPQGRGEQEAEAQPQEEDQQEAEKVGDETEGEEKAADEAVSHVETRGKECAVPHGEDEEHAGDGEAGKGRGTQDQIQGVENAAGQRATTYNRHGPWRSWETGSMNGEEGEESSTNSDEGERTAQDRKRTAQARLATACVSPRVDARYSKSKSTTL